MARNNNSVNVNNGAVSVPSRRPFSVMIQSEGYKNLINRTLTDPKRAAGFIAAITSAVSANPALQECDPATILSAGLLGEALNLSPSPQLGQYYLVPYNDNDRNCKVAQFQLGYKGYIQLAIRSGQYKKLNVLPIKQGELISYDPLNEEIEVQLVENESERANLPTIGYYAMFEYLNGFKKAIYWSRGKMENHAQTYSFAYRKGYGSSFWLKDFDSMACKTMLRQLISKWGIMSVEFQKAYEADMGVLRENQEPEYVDNVPDDLPALEPAVEAEAVVEESK